MGKLQVVHDRMTKAWQAMRAEWLTTRESWRDTDRDRFEREIIGEMEQSCNVYIQALGRLDEAVTRILNDAP